MKAIHTSDWHLGQSFYGIERSEEHLFFLEQLCSIIREESPQVLIISGDIYDSVAPNLTTQKLYNKMLLELHATLPSMKIVVTAGNHDSSSRLELNESLWEAFDVKIVGNIDRKDDVVNYDKHIVEIYNGNGERCCYVIAVPYVYHANYPLIENSNENRMYCFHQKLIDRVNEMNKDGLPIIMTGHLAVTGIDIKGHEANQTRLVFEHIENLGNGYDYLALGHIHRPQFVVGTKNARYSGSPLPVNFDEDYVHTVSIVEIEKHSTPPIIREIEIKPLIPFYTIPQKGGNIDEVLQAIQSLPKGKSYVRVKLNVKDIVPMSDRNRIEEEFTRIEAELCELQPIREQKTSNKKLNIAVEEIKRISPIEIAKDYYRQHFGCEMDEELKQMFFESIETVEKELINKEMI